MTTEQLIDRAIKDLRRASELKEMLRLAQKYKHENPLLAAVLEGEPTCA
jgi:hypothetical protein